MTRRAEWRPPSDDRKRGASLLRSWLRDVWTIPLVRGAAAVPVMLFVLLALVAFTVGVSIALFHYIGHLLGVLVAGATYAVLLFVARQFIRWYGTEKPEKPLPPAFLHLPLPPNTFHARLAIRHRSALTGMDGGALAFGDGWLHFDGVRTAFSLRAEDGQGEWDGNQLGMVVISV